MRGLTQTNPEKFWGTVLAEKHTITVVKLMYEWAELNLHRVDEKIATGIYGVRILTPANVDKWI